MRRVTATALTAVLAATLGRSAGADGPAADPLPDSPPAGYRLVWSDEFNDAGKPDPTKWTYESGFVRNREPQRYTDDLGNARVEDGHLVVEAKVDRAHPGQFTSASVITKGRASWTYGRVEVRAELPTAAGAWPAIWMLGDSRGRERWPLCGETDIMELWAGRDPHLVHSTVHFAHNGKHGSKAAVIRVDDVAAYHVYATEWTPDTFTFSVDGRTIGTVDIAKLGVDGTAFHSPKYLLLNLALDTKQGPISPRDLPMRMLVDWVRVYQKQ